jgi:hypothetical protein
VLPQAHATSSHPGVVSLARLALRNLALLTPEVRIDRRTDP